MLFVFLLKREYKEKMEGNLEQEIIKIRWHARGGEGAKTGSEILAKTVIYLGYWAQSFPEYGPERTGAPISAFNRISQNPQTIHSAVAKPDIVVVLDDTLFKSIKAKITAGTNKKTIFIVNSDQTIRLPGKVIQIDLAKLINSSFVNIPIISQIIKNLALFGLKIEKEEFLPAIKKALQEKFDDPQTVNKNINWLKIVWEAK